MRAGTIFSTAVWAVAVTACGALLTKHQFEQGVPAIKEPRTVSKGDQRSTILVFLHPQCPCSHATVAELSRIITASRGAAYAELYFYRPSSKSPSWCRTSLWDEAGLIPDTVLREDPDGRSAARFDAHTSGQVLLYSAKGKLEFSGGITEGRGHEGDNDGESAVIDFITTGRGPRTSTPVFGCVIG